MTHPVNFYCKGNNCIGTAKEKWQGVTCIHCLQFSFYNCDFFFHCQQRFCRNLNVARGNGPQREKLQNPEKFKSILDRNGAEQFLFELGKELGLEISYGKVNDVTSDGRFLSVVQVGVDPIIVCVASAVSPEAAKIESCKNALEYIKILAKF